MIRNSLRQLMRTPVKTVMFLLLFAASTLVVALGINLWYVSATNMARFEEIFTTIGTVEQKPKSIEKGSSWDWGTKRNRYGNYAVYGDPCPLDDLLIDGIEYLSGPERRPYYSADAPGMKLWVDGTGFFNTMIVIASPLEDGVPAGPIKMQIKEALFQYYPSNSINFLFCDHTNPEPEMMYKDKLYIMSLQASVGHDWRRNIMTSNEYLPVYGVISSQSTKDGVLIGDALQEQTVQEITDGFYESDDWKHWQAFIEARKHAFASIPVTPTNNIHIMMPFYNGDAFIKDGTEFTPDDYALGNKVCLISQQFARRNGLAVGGTLRLPLRSANYAQSADIGSDMEWGGELGLLNAKGEIYPIFEDSVYTIIGIYDIVPGASSASGYKLHRNEVIVPAASIKNSDENNILQWGPMKGYTTSFQIKNGTADEFMEVWNEHGNPALEITFYDKGFSKLEDGLNQMKSMSYTLLAAGVVTAVFILLFFCHMLITKQQRRTAVERSLGMTRTQCALSLLLGILLLAIIGSAAGGIGGALLTDEGVRATTQAPMYSRQYSNGQLEVGEGTDAQIEAGSMAEHMRLSLGAGAVMLVVAGAMSTMTVCRSLKREPLELLSGER